MTKTQKVTRAAAAAMATATAKEFLKFDHESVVDGKEVEEDDASLGKEKRKRDIADWIGRPCKPPSSNKYEEAESEEEYVGATQSSTEDKSLIEKNKEVREYDQVTEVS